MDPENLGRMWKFIMKMEWGGLRGGWGEGGREGGREKGRVGREGEERIREERGKEGKEGGGKRRREKGKEGRNEIWGEGEGGRVEEEGGEEGERKNNLFFNFIHPSDLVTLRKTWATCLV